MNAEQMRSTALAFITEMQACVRGVDFERAQPLFAEDVVAFGTYATVITGRDRLEREQWRNVWPNIRDFTFRLDDLMCLGDPESICVVVSWDSLGTRDDGTLFERPGRATLLLVERDGRWVAAHSHFSLAPVSSSRFDPLNERRPPSMS